MTMTSTSFHKLNPDTDLTKSQKRFWFYLNLLNNFFPNNAPGLKVKAFCPDFDENDWKKTIKTCSPARVFSNLFWRKLDWETIKSELLGDINVFDVGCGRGHYALILDEFSNGNISRYCGIDLNPHKNWEKTMREHKFITFKKQDCSNISGSIPNNTNFFMSQSALEHFENDLSYFRQVLDFIEDTAQNTIQIHLFPSSACIKLYCRHGIRQYTPRTVSKITRLFARNSYSILFKLGGKRCNGLHYRFITEPVRIKKTGDMRYTRTEEYEFLLKEAVEQDIKSKNNHPTFYALVIHSNYKNKIFETMENLTIHSN